MTLEDFFTLTEMKDGLTVPSRVEELLNVMQKEKDCVVKNVGDATRQWAAVASTIAATENKDCLDLFIQLDGLWFIDRWLKDAQKFGKDTSDSCVEESITALLRALEKLHIDNERSISSGILITVKNLLGHNSSKVQDRARMLFDSWQHGKDCDSIHQDVDDVNRRLAEEDCGQSALDNPISRGSANEENHVLEHARDEVSPTSRSDDLQPEKIEDVQIPNHHDQAGSHTVSGPEDTKDGPPDPLASSLLSNPLQENPSTKEESPVHAAEGTTSTGTCSVTVTKQDSDEVLSDVVRLNESSKSEKQVHEAGTSSDKLGVTEISSASGALESGAACTGDEAGSEKKIVREPALQNSVDANEKPASDFKSRLDDMRVINRCSANALKTTGQDDECCSNALLSANGISGKPEDLDTTFSTMEDIGEADEDTEHTSDEGDDFMKASDFPKSAMHTKNPDAIDKRRSDIENEYGMVDALEVARQVAQEVEREMVDCREPFCSSSSEKILEGGIRQPGSPDSINGKQDQPTDVPQEEVPTGQSHSAETNPEGEGGSINSDNLDNEPENSTHDMESSQVTEAAQEPEVNIEKGPCDFDLNQEVCSDEMDCPINLLTPISFVSASRPAAAPGLPVAPLQFEGSLGWKGCAATSAFRPFRPASPRRIPDEASRICRLDVSETATKKSDFVDLAEKERNHQIMQNFSNKAIWNVLKQYKQKLKVAESEIQSLKENLSNEKTRSLELGKELEDLKSCCSCSEGLRKDASLVKVYTSSESKVDLKGCGSSNIDEKDVDLHSSDLKASYCSSTLEKCDSSPREDKDMLSQVSTSDVDAVNPSCFCVENSDQQNFQIGDIYLGNGHNTEGLNEYSGIEDNYSNFEVTGYSQSHGMVRNDSCSSVELDQLLTEEDEKSLHLPPSPKDDVALTQGCSIVDVPESQPIFDASCKDLNFEKLSRKLLPVSSTLPRDCRTLDVEDGLTEPTELLDPPQSQEEDVTFTKVSEVVDVPDIEPRVDLSCKAGKPKRRLAPASSILLRDFSTLDVEDDAEKPKGNRGGRKLAADDRKTTQGKNRSPAFT